MKITDHGFDYDGGSGLWGGGIKIRKFEAESDVVCLGRSMVSMYQIVELPEMVSAPMDLNNPSPRNLMVVCHHHEGSFTQTLEEAIAHHNMLINDADTLEQRDEWRLLLKEITK